MAADSMPVPSGGDQDRGSALIAVYWVFLVVALTITLLRIYARRMIKSIGRDDYVMAFTMENLYQESQAAIRPADFEPFKLIFSILTAITTVLALRGGTKHTIYLSPAQLSTVVRLNWIAQPFGIMSLATAKISVAFFILRIMGPHSSWRQWFLYTCIILVFVINSLCSIFSFAQCDPPNALWEEIPNARCWDPKTQSDFSVFTGSKNPLSAKC